MATTSAEPPARLPYLDGWRGIAVLLVVAFHFFNVRFINIGRVGVDMFFVLSGRLMAQILFINRTGLGTFYWRRISRIYPALVVFCILVVAASRVVSSVQPIGMRDLVVALTFTSNYVSAFSSMSELLDHTWSLSVEEHSYLLLSVVALIHRRQRIDVIKVLLLISAVCMINGAICTIVLGQASHQVYWRTDVRLASIFLSAALFLRTVQLKPAVPPYTPILCLLVGCALNASGVPDYIRYSLGTLCFAYAIANLETAPSLMRALSSRWIAAVGIVSYSLYLWQQPFAVIRHDFPRPYLVPIAAAFCCAALSYAGLEKPLRAWLNGLWARLAAPRQVALPRG